uniref:Uncharacterized protein n=1 Tax=Panagrolaimus sp. ES5 TaxID=591445 RepID=A0AC34FU09_9BILA
MCPKFFVFKVINDNGESIWGKLPCDSDAVEIINDLKNREPDYRNSQSVEWKASCNIPSEPSPLKKRDGVHWYLVLHQNGNIAVKTSNLIVNSDYLLAEMQTSGFDSYKNPKIVIIE